MQHRRGQRSTQTISPSRPNTTDTYAHIFKHAYLHKYKANANDCTDTCFVLAFKFDWGTLSRLALTALTFMMDRIGGKKVRNWAIQPKFEKTASHP